MRVPESIISGTYIHFERIPRNFPSCVVIRERLWRLSQVVGSRWHVVTIMLLERFVQRTAVGSIGRPPLTDAVQKLRPEAARPCSRDCDAQEQWPTQQGSYDATFSADLTSVRI